jgi:signal transduction histidine kinase
MPLAAQLIALLVGGLVVAQLVTALLVLELPPPRAPVYRAADVAAALSGGTLQPVYGRRLVLSTTRKPPRPSGEAWMNEAFRRELAQALRVPEQRVRVSVHPPSRVLEWMGAGWERRQRRFGERPPQGPDARGSGARGPDSRGPPRRGEPPIVGDFAAAVQGANGLWTIASPTPEPFPNDWQARIMLWLLGCLLVLAPAGYLFARRITAPLGAFARAADRLGRDARTEPLRIHGPAEVSVAARAFNEMQERLRRYVDDRTAMVGAISHDLRTPLARMRFKLEAAPEAVRDAALSDVTQMEHMITAVLRFIKDAGTPGERTKLDLLSLLECVVDEAAGAGADVRLTSTYPIVIEGDELALQRLFENLVENAAKYGRRATVSLVEANGEAVVEIADEGPGIAAAEMERVFEPFYRAEAARTLDGSGVGLGLAIARSIARAHGGDVTLSSPGQGLVARVSLPLPQ